MRSSDRASSPAAAAAEREILVLRAGSGEVGIRFKQRGTDVYWLADVEGDVLEERTAGSSGTRLQTLWRSSLANGCAGLALTAICPFPACRAPERKNLYH